eukprot:scaffold3795_cov35-Phaeocystis_antarctica.AAC.1
MSLVVSNPEARKQPGKSPDSTTRQPGNPAAPGSTRQHPKVDTRPHSLWQSTRQHPAHPGTRQHPATRH